MAIIQPASSQYRSSTKLAALPTSFCQVNRNGALLVPIELNWSVANYPVGGAFVDLGAIPPPNGIDCIKALRVDNSQVAANVTLFFPDTGWSATVAPQKIETVIVSTNLTHFIVSISDINVVGTTRILVSNTIIPDYQTENEILGLASPDATNTLPSPVLRAFALGDASYGFFIDLSTITDNTTVAILPNATGGHYIITDIQVTTMRLRCYTGNTLFKWTFTHWTNPGSAPVGFINVPSDRSALNTQVHFALKGQLLLDATMGFSINFPTGFFGGVAGAVICGALMVNFSYTQTSQ